MKNTIVVVVAAILAIIIGVGIAYVSLTLLPKLNQPVRHSTTLQLTTSTVANSALASSSQAIATSSLNVSPLQLSSAETFLSLQEKCYQEKSAVVNEYKSSTSTSISISPIILTGVVNFPNQNFSINSLTAQSGIVDESQVNKDGHFCLVSNKQLKSVVVSVSNGKNLILLSLANPNSDQNLFVVDATSTAVAILDTMYASLLSPADNQKVINLLYSLPESLNFITALSKNLIKMPATSTLDVITAIPSVSNLENLASDAISKNIK